MRTLLIDGDIFAYRAACAAEKVFTFDDTEGESHYADLEEGVEALDETIQGFLTHLFAERAMVALTPTGDPDNFRRSLMPDYKEARGDVRRPIILEELKQHLVDKYAAVMKPTLEADDILGIWATNPKLVPGEKIIVTVDKDLRTIPGLHYNPLKSDEGIVEVTEEEADFNHLYQTLIGDRVDGFGGCPLIGPVKARRDLAAYEGWFHYDHVLRSGPRKGTSVVRWKKTPMTSLWAVVLSHFKHAGLTWEDALIQAQVARICRHSDFNYATQRPIPWQPNSI